MKKTAIQQAINQIENEITASKVDEAYYKKNMQMNSARTEHDIQTGLLQAISILKIILPLEQKNIESAFDTGGQDWQDCECVGIMWFDTEAGRWECTNRLSIDIDQFIEEINKNCEVIGNIFTHPHLLTQNG